MVVELRSLRITSEFDSGRYVAGMDAKVAADRRGADSSKAVGEAVDDQKIKVANAVPLLERLSRTYVDGYGTAAKFNAEVLRLAKSQDTSAASVAHLEQVYAGMQTRFGLTANATELASRGYVGLATAIENVNSRLQAQASAAERAASATQRVVAANQNRGGASGYSSNIAAQLQDVAVTAQYGNPIQVALQQGTQLSAVFNELKRDGQGVGTALAGAFMSIINPMSLVTLGVIAGGVALYQYMSSGSSEAEKLNQKLQEQEGLIGRVAKRWGEAYPALKEYADQLERTANAGQLEAAQTAASERRFRELKIVMDALVAATPEVSRSLRDITSPQGTQAAIAYEQAVADMRKALEAGKDPSDALGRATTALGTIVEQGGTAKLREYGDQIDILAQKFGSAVGQVEAFKMQLPSLGTLQGPWSEGGKLLFPEQFTPANPAGPSRRPLIELEGLPGQTKENEASGRSYRDVVKNAQDRIDQMQLEAKVSGQNGIAAQRLRFELELLQDAQDKGRKVTPEQRAEIEKLGQAYQQAAQQADMARYQQSQGERLQTLRAELALVGQSEEVRGRTLALLQAERQIRQMGLGSSSQEAANIRANAEALSDMERVLDRQADAWTRLKSAGVDAIDGMIDKLTEGDFAGAFDDAAKSVQKYLIEAPIKNPIRNRLEAL